MWQGRVDGAARWCVTDRTGGASAPPYDTWNLGHHVGDAPAAVAANRSRLAAAVGVDVAHLVFMGQVHGRDVRIVDGPVEGPVDGVDALVTATPGLALAVLVADCVPVLLVDPVAGVAGAAHAGWRGVAADVVGATVDRMVDLGARPDRLLAVLGPAICPRCYPVPAERVSEVAAVAPAAVAVAGDGSPALDLRAGLAGRLADLGATPVLIGPCTVETADLYSFRREGTTGRFAGVVVLDPRPGPA